MTNHAGRLYVLALGLFVFFLVWAAVAAHPWAPAPAEDPRLKTLAIREAQLRREATLVSQIVAQQAQLASVARKRQLAAVAPAPAPAPVRIVNLPPLTITRTS